MLITLLTIFKSSFTFELPWRPSPNTDALSSSCSSSSLPDIYPSPSSDTGSCYLCTSQSSHHQHPDMAVSLTHNAILALNSGEVDLHPLVQVLDVRQIGSGQSVQERYRLVLSDGVYVQQAMLATQLNEFVKSNQVQKGSIVKLIEYICNTVQNRKIIIVLNMDVAVSVADIIGDPKQVIMNEESLAAATANARQQQPPQQTHQPPPPQPQQLSVLQPPQPQIQSHAPVQHSPIVRPPQPISNVDYKPAPPVSMHAKENIVPPHSNAPPSKPVPPVGQGNYSGFGGGNPQASMGNNGYSSNGHGPMGGGPYSINGNSTYGRPVGVPNQPAPMYSNRGPITRNEAPARIIPIAALNPYQGRWTIKARVTSKGDLRRFHNAKGEGKVFSFDLLDAEGGEIRATCFNNVADQFYDRIAVGKVFMISKGVLKPAQKTYNHLKNDWEIMLENSSTIEPCYGEDESIPQQQFDFKPLSEIENIESNAMVDVIGVVATINPSSSIMRKNGTETQKRSLQLRDSSGRSVELTMWGSFCNSEGQQLQDFCDSGQCPVLAVKAARVSDFGGKTLGTISSSQLLINPNLPQAIEVKEWFERVGKHASFQSISRESGSGGARADMRKTVAQIKDEGLGRSEKPDWIALKATISFIKTDNFCYTACPLPVGDRQCNKKVINNGDGTWRCDRCDKSLAECDYRYLLSVQVQDHTGVTWVTAFQEAGEEIMGVSAKELYMWKQEEHPNYGELIQKLLFTPYLLKLKVKEENYNDESRVKSTVVKAEKLDFSAESKVLIDTIGKLARGELPSGPAASISGYSGPTPATMGVSAGGGFGGSTYSANANMGNGFGNSNMNGYGGGDGISCFKCGGGHFARECPNDKSMGGGQFNSNMGGGFGGGGGGAIGAGGGGTNTCYKCGQGGHWARDCPGQGGGAGFGRESNYGNYGVNAAYGRGY